MVKDLSGSRMVAFDTETTALDPLRADLVGISLAVREGEGYYIPVGHKTQAAQLPVDKVINALTPVMTNPAIQKVGHNIKYDALVLGNYGLEVRPLSFDTMIGEWLVDPASRNLGLKDMADSLLDISMTHIEELIGRGKDQVSMDVVAIASAAPYAAARCRGNPAPGSGGEKADAGAQLHEDFRRDRNAPRAGPDQHGAGRYLTRYRFSGKNSAAKVGKRLAQIESEVYDQVGHTFNLNSTQQLSKVLFEGLKLEPPDRGKKTASGHYSTSAAVLDELKGKHPVVDLLLEYRELAKLKSTYLDALPLQVNPRTRRVHTSFNQTGSVTGRLASSDPNLQNIPTRTDLGHQVRLGFVASPGSFPGLGGLQPDRTAHCCSYVR